MKQVKKVLSFALALILLVTACYTNGLGVSAGVMDSTVNTSVTKIDFANNALRFYLSDNDYGTTNESASNQSAASYTDYNYWENIQIYTDEDTSKTLQEAYTNRANSGNTTFYNLWTVWGTYAVSIDADSISNAVKVVIPAGTEFPSYGYTTGASSTKKAYVTTADITFIKKGNNWEEYIAPTPVDTSVTELAIANNGFRFRLSTNDYGTIKGSDTSADSYTLDYNYMSKVLVYTDDATSYRLKDIYNSTSHHTFFNLWTDWGTFAVQTDTTVLNAATKVVIPAGTEFPSLEYVTGASAEKIGYVTTAETIFINKNGTWEKYIAPTPVNTSVTELAIANNGFRFRLSTNDYGTTKGSDTSADSYTLDYNYMSKVLVYTDDATSYRLKDIYNSTSHHTFFNLWTDWGTFAVQTDTIVLNAATKVVIPAGTEFPSLEYVTGASAEKIGYVTTDEVIYVKDGSAWKEYVAPIARDTSVTELAIANNAFRFRLSANDYGNTKGSNTSANSFTTEYNYLDNILVYTDSTTSYKLKDKYKAGTHHNFFNLWEDWGTFAVQIDTTVLNAATKVVIPAGTAFPSLEYTTRASKGKISYVTTADITFKKNGSTWEEYVAPVTKDTSVTELAIANNAFRFRLSAHDYGNTKGSNTSANSFTTEYNYLDNILVYTDSTTSYKLKDKYKAGTHHNFFNLWEDWGTFAVQIDTTVLNAATKVVIPAGTAFPSLEYTTRASKGKISYVTTADITFVKNGSAWTEYIAPTTADTSVTELAIANNAFRFRLSAHDYGTTKGSDNSADNFTTEYNYLDNILVYTDSTTSYKLKDKYKAGTHHNFFNLWEDWGTFAVQIDTTVLNAATKVVIPAGTAFPSLEYTTGATTVKKSYVTTEESTFVKKGDAWVEYVEQENITTNIEKIHVRNGFVLLFLSKHDYASVPHTESIGDKLSAYNLTQNIMITKDGVTKKLSEIPGSEQYYNIWEETGCVAFKMASGYDGTTVTRVAVKKGAEFPAYAYTSTSTKKVTAYVTNKDYVFNTGKQTEADNTVWTKVTPYSSATDITDVSVSGSKLTFTLSENDYVAGAVGSNHTDFDYWNKVKVYTDDTTAVPLSTWANATSATYGSDTLSVTGNSDAVRIVIPAKTVFPSHKYTSEQIGECVGYYVAGEKVFDNQNGIWTNVSRGVSKVSGDVNGDKEVNSLDIIAMAKYAKNGYGYNASSLTYDKTQDEAGNRHIVRRVILGDVLHNYEKESDNLTYFSSSDLGLDSFLNDFYKRHIGYNDYVEGDMTVTSYKPGTTYNGIYNLPWLTKSLLWVDSKNSLESDRAAQLKEQIDSIIVDRYGYVWNGDDAVEAPELGIGKKHGMGWPFPNASHAGGSGNNANVRYWEFNASDSVSTWSSNISASLSGGLYQGTASDTSSVTFTVEDYGVTKSPIIRETSCAPWLIFELRMNGVTNPENIEDIYVKWVNSDSSTEHTVKAGDIAAVNYAFTDNYEHVLYLPMYTHEQWNGKQIKKITIEIRGKDAFSGTIALNYVRPSYDTRHSNNNANYIEALKEYYNMTGDVDFVKANITKARKAMNFYLQMYVNTLQLNDQSYLYGHGGSRTALETGLGNGYWDILYTPQYDFQSNMYFYQALKDLSYLEGVLSTNHVSVGESATIDTATTSGKDTSTYSKTASDLDAIADAVVGKMRTYFWNGTRFVAGKDDSDKEVDYGYTTWNLQAIELGIADKDQREKIMQWIGKPDSTENDLYHFGFAPRTATENKTGIYGAFIKNGGNDTVKNQAFGESLQFGGAVMYSSYYDLTSRIQVNGADDALKRLKGIQTWYDDVSNYFNNNNVANDEFYFQYFLSKNINPQNGSKEGYGNGAVGVDGEFTESLLVTAAIPYGFFGMDSEGGNTLCVSPSLPSTMDHWKVENMQYNGVTYDLSIYKDAVRIDSVRGTTTGLKVKVTLDCPSGKDIYVNGEKATATKAGGKATVKVDFAEAIIEVK